MTTIRATLVIVSSIKPAETLEVIRSCSRQVRFTGGVIWFTDTVSQCAEATVVPVRIGSLDEYSLFMLHNLPLYRRLFREHHLLVAQPDSLIVNPTAWHDFLLDFDYIGAPWPDGTVGNGGFSLRSLKLLDCLHRLSWEIAHTPRRDEAEDAVISREMAPRLKLMGCRFPEAREAARFSTEAWPERPYRYEGSFGVHGTPAVQAALASLRAESG
jgi:hypothetical protein